ncbi:MAG TPA: hypothetical protein VHE30_26760 [Polyangiaceae bacterium]|nr:hypothetical protein [Polyangiaceae bacterium]
MNFHTIHTLSALTLGAALALALPACGVGDDANVGDSNNSQHGQGSGGGSSANPGSGGQAHGAGGGSAGATGGGTAGAHGGGIACGKNTCGAGQYCCNASCGMCAPMGAACIQIACNPDPGACTTDADCRTQADYCSGCDCRALGPGQTVPACNGAAVQCFADACLDKTAACVNGACVLVSPLPPQTQCQTDADCSIVDDYCTGCECRALAKGETPPKCDGAGGVQCLVEPCQGKTPACVAGACVAQ